ncbi:major facilitator superfamily domain-containing protein [Panaeolus papilionaceus]|nr:major facilitator superfamily domain-containing protein [Panaeolus papilionaceus]
MGSILLSEDSFPSATSTSNTKRHSIHLHSSPCPSLPYPTSTSLTSDRIDHLRQSHNTLEPKLAVAGALISLLFSFGHMNAFGTYQAWYASHQLRHVSLFRISLIGSLQLWVFFLSGAPIGCLFDAYGSKWLMLTGTACYVLSLVLTSFCAQYYQYVLAHGVLFGLSLGLLFYPPIASLSLLFNKYRATAVGIAAAGSSLGGVIYPIVLRRLFEGVGFGWGVRIVALASGAGCLVSTFLIPRTKTSPSGEPSGTKYRRSACSNTSFIFLTLGSCLVVLGIFIPFFYIVDYSQQHGIPGDTAIDVLAIMNAGGMVGRIAPAYLSDIIGQLNLLFPSAFLSGLACVCLWPISTSFPSIGTFAALFGFSSGAYISLVTPCIAQVSNPKEIGRKIGILYSTISLFALCGGPIAGHLLTTHHDRFLPVMYFSGTSLLVGSLFVFGAKMSFDHMLFARV